MRPVYASDIYAVGVTCIYLLTGKSPKEINYNPTTGEMLWEREVFVSQHMTGVLRKMLEPSVRYRYQSASEVLNALYLEQNFDSLAQSMAAQSGVRKTSRPSQAQVDSHARQSVAGVAEAIRRDEASQ